MTDLTHRQKMVLAGLAAAHGQTFAPVQIQKLFFILDENIANQIGGRQFRFEPYHFGPFDRSVYDEVKALSRKGLANVESLGPWAGSRIYYLTPAGQTEGESILKILPASATDYIKKAGDWVRSLSFEELVGSIYKAYPHMKANSIFVDE